MIFFFIVVVVFSMSASFFGVCELCACVCELEESRFVKYALRTYNSSRRFPVSNVEHIPFIYRHFFLSSLSLSLVYILRSRASHPYI